MFTTVQQPPFFYQQSVNIWQPRRPAVGLLRGMLSHSCLMEDVGLLRSPHIFGFTILQCFRPVSQMYFFTDWSTSVHLLLGIKRTSADLFPINLISRELFLELFLFSTTSFYSLLLPPSQLFETCYCHHSQNELIFFSKQQKVSI